MEKTPPLHLRTPDWKVWLTATEDAARESEIWGLLHRTGLVEVGGGWVQGGWLSLYPWSGAGGGQVGKKSPAAARRLQAEGARSLFASLLWLEKAGVVLRHSSRAVTSTGDGAARNARSGRLGAQSRQHPSTTPWSSGLCAALQTQSFAADWGEIAWRVPWPRRAYSWLFHTLPGL